MINIRRPWHDFDEDEETYIVLHFEVVEDDEA